MKSNPPKFAKKESEGTIKCSNKVFGDPVPGVRKSCYCVGTQPTEEECENGQTFNERFNRCEGEAKDESTSGESTTPAGEGNDLSNMSTEQMLKFLLANKDKWGGMLKIQLIGTNDKGEQQNLFTHTQKVSTDDMQKARKKLKDHNKKQDSSAFGVSKNSVRDSVSSWFGYRSNS